MAAAPMSAEGASAPSIRAARPDDVALVLDFVRALARDEGFPGTVQATEAGLSDALFGPEPAAEALIAELGGEAVGFAVFYRTFSTVVGRPGIHLDDLYVRPEARGHGIGERLLARVAGLAHERGCGRLDWWVLSWNDGAARFYRRLGATWAEELQVWRLEGEALARVGAAAADGASP